MGVSAGTAAMVNPERKASPLRGRRRRDPGRSWSWGRARMLQRRGSSPRNTGSPAPTWLLRARARRVRAEREGLRRSCYQARGAAPPPSRPRGESLCAVLVVRSAAWIRTARGRSRPLRPGLLRLTFGWEYCRTRTRKGPGFLSCAGILIREGGGGLCRKESRSWQCNW